MVRRKDQSFGGRWVAGEFGDLFLLTDGVSPFFTGDEVYPSREIAEAAWERARVSTWRHEHRSNIWAPVGARAYDGLGCSEDDIGVPDRKRFESALDALDRHRAERPDLAVVLADEYDEYGHGLELLLGLLDRRGTDTLDLRGAEGDYFAYCGIIERRPRGKRAA